MVLCPLNGDIGRENSDWVPQETAEKQKQLDEACPVMGKLA